MPTKEKGGSYRTRRKTPGYNNGVLIMRLGTSDRRVAETRENFLVGLYQGGDWDVLDALRTRKITFPQAFAIKREGDLPKLRNHVAEADNRSQKRDAFALAEEWKESRTGECEPRTIEDTHRKVVAFLTYVRDKFNVGETPLDVALLTKDELKEYRDLEVAKRKPLRIKKDLALHPANGKHLTKRERRDLEQKAEGAVRATVNRHVNGVGPFGTWLVKKGILTVSPAEDVRWSTKEENRYREETYRYLEPEEVRQLLRTARIISTEEHLSQTVSEPDHEFLEFLVSTGARVLSEGTRALASHVQMGRVTPGSVTVPVYLAGTKSAKRSRREVEISLSLGQRLVERAKRLRLGKKRLLFPFTDKDYMRFWRRVMERLRIESPDVWDNVHDAMPGDLRHTFAVNALRNGTDLVQLKDLMGHADIATTMIYAKHAKKPTPALAAMAMQFGTDLQ